jgi:hypothetical protein
LGLLSTPFFFLFPANESRDTDHSGNWIQSAFYGQIPSGTVFCRSLWLYAFVHHHMMPIAGMNARGTYGLLWLHAAIQAADPAAIKELSNNGRYALTQKAEIGLSCRQEIAVAAIRDVNRKEIRAIIIAGRI